MRPVFAVVGHPNKGKSSIVSTLARNDTIRISQQSGTTTTADCVRVETAHAGYELVDTPGFQRPGKVLEWLQQKGVAADQRVAVIQQFLADEQCQQRFPDEIRLLTPIMQGAAILYVVDGSRPFGVEYEAEMEILRWTGQPSMALINPIENEDYVESWSKALAQYFKIVRVFNPFQADFAKQLALLEAFAHLKPEWREALDQVNQDLIQFREQQKQDSAELLARLLEDLCQYRVSQKVLEKSQADVVYPVLAEKYHHWMRQREQQTITELLAVYAHFQTKISVDELHLPPDLFDCEHWFMWGLDKQQLAIAAALAGATAGAAADMVVAGHSFMLGAIGGGILGFGSAWLGADKLQQMKVKGLPLGGFEAICGPVSNPNFPYVVIGRFVYLYQQISRRNHAQRTPLVINPLNLNEQIEQLDKADRKALHAACARLIKQKTVDSLSLLLLPLLN
ncbi:GTPase/DUF3482 domain-containing protein [Aliikangiella maris]|uniref:GTPase/DUF3482 domain-containing protein n=2 Tax=Aliikangiella maris TaxID=3162458 RepID=A0ABV3MT70_9GAMM